MSDKLVIVESPAKARTLTGILGRGYTVKASLGHVRDLPKTRLGVDVEKDFAPTYVIVPERKKIVKEIKEAAPKAKSIFLATDPDREGEAISCHLIKAAKLDKDDTPNAWAISAKVGETPSLLMYWLTKLSNSFCLA